MIDLVEKILVLRRANDFANTANASSQHEHTTGTQANEDRGGGGVLPYMGHIGMCRCEGYGFQGVYFSLGYINQSVWV